MKRVQIYCSRMIKKIKPFLYRFLQNYLTHNGVNNFKFYQKVMRESAFNTLFKINISNLFLMVIILMGNVSMLAAQEEDKENTLVVFPFAAYSPDTSLMLGASVIYVVRKDESDVTAQDIADTYQMVTLYTLKNQILFAAVASNYFEQGLYLNKVTFSFKKFDSSFYGAGATSSVDNEDNYVPLAYSLEDIFYTRIIDNLYVGPAWLLKYYTAYQYNKDGAFNNSSIPGIKESRVSAPGAALLYDSTDASFFPTTGVRMSSAFWLNSSTLGATQDSQRLEILGSTYIDIAQARYILGFQFKSIMQWGNVPFDLYEGVGGDSLLRGYKGDRYIDRTLYAAQSEFRFPFEFFDGISSLNRISAAVFAGVGSVAPNVSDMGETKQQYAVGGGLRYSLSQREKINLRVDITYNREGEIQPYVQIRESF